MRLIYLKSENKPNFIGTCLWSDFTSNTHRSMFARPIELTEVSFKRAKAIEYFDPFSENSLNPVKSGWASKPKK
jgi:hypothetical protein